MSIHPSCPICSDLSNPLFYSGDFKMYRCGSCALSFVHPLPTDDYLSDYYSRFHDTFDEGGGYELVESRINADFPAKLAKIKKYIPDRQARLLDVGCGKGFFVKACLEAGLHAEGVDLSDTAIAYARETLKVPARLGRIEQYIDSGDQFDVATFWATIEHVPRPVATLKSINAVLKKNGFLFLDTGIGNDWLDRWLPGLNQWYDPPQHLYVFSVDAIRLSLAQAGFEVLHIDQNFERTRFRKMVRTLRATAVALGLRTVAELTRFGGKDNHFNFTRYPVGNLMSIVAIKQ